MDKTKIKKTILTLLMAAAVFSIVSLKSYLTPIHEYVTEMFCSVEGETVEVTFDVTWRRYLFKPTKLEGTVYMGDKIYRTYSFYDGSDFWGRLKSKLKQGTPSSYMFYGGTDIHDSENIRVYFETPASEKKSFEAIHILVFLRKGGICPSYYGPARTAEEACALEDIFYN